MIQSKDRLISNPLFGLLLGLTAFLLPVLPVLILAQFYNNDWILLPMLLFTGLILLKLFVGPQLDYMKILGSGVASIMVFFLSVILAFSFFGFYRDNNGFIISIAIYSGSGLMFGLINFGKKALFIFIPVFLVFPLADFFFRSALQLNGAIIPADIEFAIFDGTNLDPTLLYVYITLGALFGLSIGLYNKFNLMDNPLKVDPDPPEHTDQAENKLPGKDTE